MKNAILFFSIILFLLFIEGCRKYPDDNTLTLWFKVEDKMAAAWDVNYFEVNGNDSTNYLKSNYNYGYYELYKNHHQWDSFYYFKNNNNNFMTGRWGASKDGKTFSIDFDSSFGGVGPYGAKYINWEIRKLNFINITTTRMSEIFWESLF